MLNINIKEYIREFINRKMNEAIGTSKHFNTAPGVIIYNDKQNMETFIDDLWVHINKRTMQDEQDKL